MDVVLVNVKPKPTWGGNEVISAYSSIAQSVTEGSKSRNSRRVGT